MNIRISYVFLSFLVLNSTHLLGQDTLNPSHQITLPAFGNLAIDQMENLYLVSGPEIIKLDKKGNILNRYSDNILGDITSIDITNPLQILVFYSNQSRIVFLDNTLSVQKQGISALQISDGYITQACNSNNGGFWVYNAATLELQKRDKTSGLNSSSNNLSLVVGEQIKPTLLIEKNNIIQVLTDSSLYLFDNKVNYIKKYPLKGARFLTYSNNILMTSQKNEISFLNTKTYETKKYIIPSKANDFSYYSTHNFIYHLNDKNLEMYPITN